MRKPLYTFILYRLVKALDVGVIVGFADTGVAMGDMLLVQFLGKPGTKLWSVVRLDGRESKRRCRLPAKSELGTTSRTNARRWQCVNPSAMEVNHGVDVEFAAIFAPHMNRIRL